ncbi:Metallo-beta-lactamase superfamily protein [Mycena venus]|uniref:Metallo-beta-lactamase superfamily protein n=1 Tax=Mycena venus TaxID=2733690 RepID=A0A8H6YU23_9AGAR|nr:Metallo-beta-lactamase superfamily protein [Mycena venus]
MSFLELGIPASDATVSVKAFNVVTDMRAVSVPAGPMMQPIPAGRDAFNAPVFAFLIENAATGQRVMFDLGPRKDQENAAPPIPEWLKANYFSMPVERDITEQLVDHGVELQSISAAIWSHAHFDHTGDMSKFPASTDLVFGQATVLESCEVNPKSALLESDFAGRKLVRLNFDETPLQIGGFKAKDYFDDGSFYILDVPGHLAGHVCALARVTSTSFVFLGGDGCHHPGMLRPTEKLHRHFPCPGHLLAAARRSVSVKHFPPADAAGEFDLAARTTPMLNVSEEGLYEDTHTARSSIAKMGNFDANKDVFVVIAHDETLPDVIGPFPVLLNDWKAKGLKDRVLWAFVDEANPAFRFNDKI